MTIVLEKSPYARDGHIQSKISMLDIGYALAFSQSASRTWIMLCTAGLLARSNISLMKYTVTCQTQASTSPLARTYPRVPMCRRVPMPQTSLLAPTFPLAPTYLLAPMCHQTRLPALRMNSIFLSFTGIRLHTSAGDSFQPHLELCKQVNPSRSTQIHSDHPRCQIRSFEPSCWAGKKD